ncbi:hypothetical protein Tco_1258979 [Tanacetum coccineum]
MFQKHKRLKKYVDHEQLIDVLAMDKSMLEEELRATKSKLKLYDMLFFIMLGSFLVVCVGFEWLSLECKWKLQMQMHSGNAKWYTNVHGILTMSVLGDALAFEEDDQDALTFEKDDPCALAFEKESLALVFLLPDFENQNSSLLSHPDNGRNSGAQHNDQS